MRSKNRRVFLNFLKRVAALCLACSLSFYGTTGFAAPAQSSNSTPLTQERPVDLFKLSIPKEIGSIKETFSATKMADPSSGGKADEKTVFVIQDAHEIPDAQRNIQKLVDFLETQYGTRLVALEGAATNLDPQIFRSFPDQKLLKQVFEEYRETGELVGGTAAAIFSAESGNPTIFAGVEDWDLYEKGLQYFLEAAAAEETVTKRIDALLKELKLEKEKHYSKDLLEIDRALQAFHKNDTDLLSLLIKLRAVRPPERGSELALLAEEIKASRQNPSSLETEVRKMAEGIRDFLKEATGTSRNLSFPGLTGESSLDSGFRRNDGLGVPLRKPERVDDLLDFNQKFQEFQTSKLAPEAFALFLKGLAAKYQMKVKVSESLERRIENQKRLKEIEGTKLFDDLEAYAESVKKSLFRSDEERRLGAQDRELELLERLAKLELTRKEWNELKQWKQETGNKKEEARNKKQETGSKSPSFCFLLPDSCFSSHLAFYRNSEKRDQAFFRNLTSLMNRGTPNAERGARHAAHGAILIAGGFHAEGITRAFKSKNISYALIVPAIERIPDDTHYRAHMRGEVSWADYFEVQNGKVNLYDAFVRAARDKLLKGYESEVLDSELIQNSKFKTENFLLKLWRDQIIRDLAEQNRIAESSRYTRFLDELSATQHSKLNTQNSLLKQWNSNINRFIAGLRNLKSQNQITEANILKLLTPSAIPAPAIAAPLARSELRAELIPNLRSKMPSSGLPPSASRIPHFPSRAEMRGAEGEEDLPEPKPSDSQAVAKFTGGDQVAWTEGQRLADHPEAINTLRRNVQALPQLDLALERLLYELLAKDPSLMKVSNQRLGPRLASMRSHVSAVMRGVSFIRWTRERIDLRPIAREGTSRVFEPLSLPWPAVEAVLDTDARFVRVEEHLYEHLDHQTLFHIAERVAQVLDDGATARESGVTGDKVNYMDEEFWRYEIGMNARDAKAAVSFYINAQDEMARDGFPLTSVVAYMREMAQRIRIGPTSISAQQAIEEFEHLIDALATEQTPNQQPVLWGFALSKSGKEVAQNLLSHEATPELVAVISQIHETAGGGRSDADLPDYIRRARIEIERTLAVQPATLPPDAKSETSRAEVRGEKPAEDVRVKARNSPESGQNLFFVEGMKVPGGKAGFWIGGVDLSASGQMETYKESAAADQTVTTKNRLQFLIDQNRLSEEEARVLETSLDDALRDLPAASLAPLVREQGSKAKPLQPILITKLDDSPRLFEDDAVSGFIGIHHKLLSASAAQKNAVQKILAVGLAHAIKHGALDRERSALAKRLKKSESEIASLSAEAIQEALTPDLKRAAESERFEEGLDRAAESGLQYEDLIPLIDAGILSADDGFSEGLRFHGHKKLRSRHREFLKDHDAKNHLIDRADPEFHEVFEAAREILDQLLKAAGLNPAFYRLYLSDESKANAFYLRGSDAFVVNVGLLKLLSKNGELVLSRDAVAFILAHEIQHLRQHRADVLSGTVHPGMELKIDWSLLTEELQKKYLNEYDADWNGVSLMNRAGFNVLEAPRVFRALLELMKQDKDHSSLYLPFGTHPNLEPRTAALEDVVLHRYWRNTFKPVSSFPEGLTVPISRFRNFQNRVYTMKSDEEFAELITEAEDIRELALAISIGKQRRSEPDYQLTVDPADEVNYALYALKNLFPKLEELEKEAREQADEEAYERIRARGRELIAAFPALPAELLRALMKGEPGEDFNFLLINGISSMKTSMPWGEEKWFLANIQAGDLLVLKGGSIVIIPTGEIRDHETENERIEVITLTGQSFFIRPRSLFGSKKAVIKKDSASLSAPQAPVEALTRRMEQLKANQPGKRLQLEFYEEMFKKHLDHSSRFSPRQIKESAEWRFDFYGQPKKEKKEEAFADPTEFDRFVRSSTAEELISAVENLISIWIHIEKYPVGIYWTYSNFQETLEGSREYPRGDYIELIDAIVREVERRIEEGSASNELIPKLLAALETNNSHRGTMYRQTGETKLHLFTIFTDKLLSGKAVSDRDSVRVLTELLDRLHFLSESTAWLDTRNAEASQRQDQIAQLLYGFLKNPDTKDLVTDLFQKQAGTHSPVKIKFYRLVADDPALSLDKKLRIIDELGRDPGGFWALSESLMTAPAGEGDAYVGEIIAGMIAKAPVLSPLQNGTVLLKRLAALTYLGAFERTGDLIFKTFDAEKRELLLNTGELRLFRNFIEFDLAWKKDSYRLPDLVRLDPKKQLVLLLSLVEFLKRNGQDAFIFRILLNVDSRLALGSQSYWDYMHGVPLSASKTAEGLKYDKDMRTFSMMLGELIDREADNDVAYFESRSLGIHTPQASDEEGYSVKQMTERLASSRPQRFGRWDLMQDGDKDPLDYFSFLEEIYAGRNFKDALADLVRQFPDVSRLRDFMIYVLFAQKVLRDKLGIELTPERLFDFEWLRAQIKGKGVPIHEEIQAALPFLGWDRDIQKLNGKFLAVIDHDALQVNRPVYEQEGTSYTDLRFYDIGGADSQLALVLSGFDKTFLENFLTEDHSLEEKFEMLLRYYPHASAHHDQYLRQILESALKSVEAEPTALTPTFETQILKALAALQNISLRERLAVRFLEAALKRVESQKGALTLENERNEILKYLPEPSYTRDEVLSQLLRRHVKEAARHYESIASFFVQNPEQIRERETAAHLFWKDQIRDVLMNFGTLTKTHFLLWLLGIGEKPEEVVKEEYRLHISFDGFKESFGLHEGAFYSGIGKRDRQDFFNALLLGDKGIFANESAYREFLNEVISGLIPAGRKIVRDMFEWALTTEDLSRRERILLSLLQNYGALQGIASAEEKEAKSIRMFLEANNLMGVKLGQFLAHSALVEEGSFLGKELNELKDSAEPLDIGILIDMLKKIYGERVFEDRFEYLGELVGSASIKVVHRAKLINGPEVVIKFKRPEVEKQIEKDLAFLEEMLDRFAPALRAEGIPVPAGLLKRLKEILNEELNFENEANNQRRLKQNIEPRKTVIHGGVTYEFNVPNSVEVYENSVMVEEFAGGTALKKEDELRKTGVDPAAAQEVLVEELLQEFFFDGFYNADAHSGNVLVEKTADKIRIHLIDLGAAARISASNRETLVGILMALLDQNNWDRNQEMMFRLFPQIPAAEGMSEALLEIIQSNQNPIQKLLSLFALLEKNGIELRDEYQEFYSVIRFLKASEYLFSDALLEKMKGRFLSSDLEEVKAQAAAMTEKIEREFRAVQVPAAVVDSNKGLKITVTIETIRQTFEILEGLKQLPFWATVSAPFPQVEELVDLMLGVLRYALDKGESLEITILPEKMPLYEDLKADVQFLIGLIRQGSIDPMAIMKTLAAIKRLAGQRDRIFDFVRRQNLPLSEILESVKKTAGNEAAARLEFLLKTRSEVRAQEPEDLMKGLCVTGDTLLPVVKTGKGERRKGKVEQKRIVDVRAGDWVLSLDEANETIVPRRIKGLLDMGTKPVYRLTTASGRSIKTTANHPYLVKLKTQNFRHTSRRIRQVSWRTKLKTSERAWVKVSGLRVGDEIAVPAKGYDDFFSRKGNSIDIERGRSSHRTFSSRRNFGLGVDNDVMLPSQRAGVLQSRSYVFHREGGERFEDAGSVITRREHFEDLPDHYPASSKGSLAMTNLRVRHNVGIDENPFHRFSLLLTDEIYHTLKALSSLAPLAS